MAAAQEQILQYTLHIQARKEKLNKLKARKAQKEQRKTAKKTAKVAPQTYDRSEEYVQTPH